MGKDVKGAGVKERGLLFGLLAVQLGFITPEQLTAAAGEWAVDPSADIGESMVRSRYITEIQKSSIDALLLTKVSSHGGDMKSTLASVDEDVKGSMIPGSEDLTADFERAARRSGHARGGVVVKGPDAGRKKEPPPMGRVDISFGEPEKKEEEDEEDSVDYDFRDAPTVTKMPSAADLIRLKDEERKKDAAGTLIDEEEEEEDDDQTKTISRGVGTLVDEPVPESAAKPETAGGTMVDSPARGPEKTKASSGPAGTLDAREEEEDEPPSSARTEIDGLEIDGWAADDDEEDDDDVIWSDGAELDDRAEDSTIDSQFASLVDTESLTTEHKGRYIIRSEQGRGAIGRVLVVFDQHIGREVALKELLVTSRRAKRKGKQAGEVDEATARFLGEARVTGILEHPGIVPVYEIARRQDGSIYYTMKLVRGETLEEKIEACRTMRDRYALLNSFLDLCQALAYAHSMGVIHRDIKPANVMIGEFGETVVLDWGIAKIKGVQETAKAFTADDINIMMFGSGGHTVAGKPIGTPCYMSPEQAEGALDVIDEKSDVWSLGAVLFELLSGQPPYTGESAWDVVGKVLKDPAPSVREAAPQAAPELCAICDKCLTKDRDKRYKNASRLAADIKNFLDGSRVSAYDYFSTSVDMRVIGRYLMQRWPVVATIGVALFILGIFGGWSFQRIGHERDIAIQTGEDLKTTLTDGYISKRKQAVAEKAWGSAEVYASMILTLRDTMKDRYGVSYYRTMRPLKLKSILSGHKDKVMKVLFSPDGKTLASQSVDGTAKLWEVSTGKLLHSFEGHKAWVSSMAFSPGGRTLATGGRDNALYVWDTYSGRTLQAKEEAHLGWITNVAFSPDGRTIATASRDRTIKIWDAFSGQLLNLLFGHAGDVNCIAFSPDGRFLASGSKDKTVKVWDMETAKLKYDMKGHEGLNEDVFNVAYSPDGQYIASGAFNGVIILWSATTGEMVAKMKEHTMMVNDLTFNERGDKLASAGWDGSVKIWDVPAGVMAHSLEGHGQRVVSVDFSSDGKYLASAGLDGSARLWNPTSGQLLFTLQGHPGSVYDALFSPDSKYLATCGLDANVKLWQVSSSKIDLEEDDNKVTKIAFSPDGSCLASVSEDNRIKIWSPQKGKLQTLAMHTDSIRAISFSPDGRILASAGDDFTVKLWNVRSGKLLRSFDNHVDTVTSVAFNKEGSYLISGSEDKTIKVWDTYLGEMVVNFNAHEGAVTSIKVSPHEGNVFASAGKDGVVKLWDLDKILQKKEGIFIHELKGHKGSVLELAFSPDGITLASAGKDGTAKIWNAAAGKIEHDLKGHRGAVRVIAFSPDGKILATGSSDETVKLWMTDTGRPINEDENQIRHKSWISCLAFSPDGKILATGSWDNTVKLWIAQTGELISSLDEHSDVVNDLAFSPDGSYLATASYDNSIMLWPFDKNVLSGDPKELLETSQLENGLVIEGLDLVPWTPEKPGESDGSSVE